MLKCLKGALPLADDVEGWKYKRILSHLKLDFLAEFCHNPWDGLGCRCAKKYEYFTSFLVYTDDIPSDIKRGHS